MWHVSVAGQKYWLPFDELEQLAEEELEGVGDAEVGEWREIGDRAFHLRRRLTPAEEVGIAPVVDVRGTDEASVRLYAVRKQLVKAGRLDWAEAEEGRGWRGVRL